MENKFLGLEGLAAHIAKLKQKFSAINTSLNNKVDKEDGKVLSDTNYTAAEKSKLAGIEDSANNYTHPTTSGNKHIPSGGSSGQILRWSSDGTAAWGADNNTTYNDATQSTHGLMSTADKTKLDGIDEQANNYTHPSYTAKSSGLYKITVDDKGHVSETAAVAKADITALGIPASDTNTHYESKNVVGGSTSTSNTTTALTNGNVYLNSVENGSVTSAHKISGSGATTVTADASGNIVVNSTNTTYSAATTTANGLMSAADKTKLNGIDEGANAYTHPTYTAKTSGLYKVTVDGTGHVSGTAAVAKADITALGIPGENTTYSEATTALAGLMSATDKAKLNNIAENANNYSHPTTSGNKHIPSGGSSGQILRWSSDGTAAWGADNNTTYSAATTSAAGLMSADDKTKLDGIATGATANAATSTTPKANGTAAVGTETTYARGDHVHPLQTTVSGNAGTATKLANSRTISLTGGVTGSASFDGSANASIATTVASVDASKITGTLSVSQLPAGALERCVVVANDTARYALTTDSVQLGDTVKVTATNVMYLVVDESKLNSADGYVEYSAGHATTADTATKADQLTTSRTLNVQDADGTNTGTGASFNGGANATIKLPSTIKASLTGNASTATKATQDSAGQQINTTYIKGLSASGTTVTYTKGDGTTGTFTTQDTNTHYASKNVVGSSTATANTSTALTNGNVYLNSVENGSVTSAHKISGSGATTVTTDASGNIIISSTDNNTTYSVATTSANGLMSSSDKSKLDGIATGATANSASSTTPKAAGTAAVGTETTYARGDHVHPLQTTISGNAATATKATQDSAGQQINTTYIKGLSASGTTVTYTKGDGTTGTFTTQDTNTHYASKNVVGATTATTNTTTALSNGSVYLNSVENGSVTSTHKISGSGATTVTTDTSGNIVISSTDNNTTYSAATTSAAGLMSASDKSKLDGIATGANAYTHPSATAYSSGLYKITTNATGHVTAATAVAKADITGLGIPASDTHYSSKNVVGASTATTNTTTALTNGNVYLNSVENGAVTSAHKISGSGATSVTSDASGNIVVSSTNTTYSAATTSAAGLMSASDKSKLDGIASGANAYTHPTGSGSNHIPSGGSSGQILRWASDGTATWGADNNTTYSAATTSAAGLMSAADKTKLNGIATGATANSASSTTPKAAGTAAVGSESAYARGDHVHPLQTTVSGNAGTATTLATARTIGIGTGATGTATSFNGSANITIPITDVKESYLSWGGKNFTGDYGCIDAAMIPDLGANRFAFGKAAGITIQYSRNSGSTWTDYGATDAQKVGLFGTGQSFGIGKNDSSNKANATYQLQVIINTGSFQCYSQLNKFAIYLSTNGSSGCWCSIDIALESTPTTWVNKANKVSVSGWSGWNIINTDTFSTYGNTASTQYGRIRFTFGCTGGSTSYSGMSVSRIMAFGGVGWTTPSNMAKYGTIYSYDNSQNVTFPAAVTASSFSGNASSATKATQDSAGQQINTTYIKGLSVSGTTITYTKGDGSTATITTQDTNTTYSTATQSANGLMSSSDKTKLDGIATGANAYTHPSATAYASGLYKITTNSLGHVTAATAVAKADITGLGIPASDTHYSSKNVVGSSTATTNTTSALTNGNVYINSVENGAVTSAHKISGSGATTVTTDASGNIVITSTDNNTTYSTATTSANGLMSSSDKKKLDGIATGANAYTHPTTSGNKHIPSGGSSGQFLKWSADGTATWAADNNTTYSAGTGLSLSSTTFSLATSGVTAGTKGPTANVTGSNGATIKVPSLTVDTYGRVTALGEYTFTAQNTTYSAATTSANGLMSASDKSKLDGINTTDIPLTSLQALANAIIALIPDGTNTSY